MLAATVTSVYPICNIRWMPLVEQYTAVAIWPARKWELANTVPVSTSFVPLALLAALIVRQALDTLLCNMNS